MLLSDNNCENFYKGKNLHVCLQETHLKVGEERWLRRLFRGDIFQSPSYTRSRGIMIGVAENVPWETNTAQIDEKGRYVILEGKWIKTEILIVGVYAPHIHQAQFWKELFDVILQMGVMEMIVLEDFNATICNSIARSSNSPFLTGGYL